MVFNFTFNNITVILWNINRYNCVTIMKTNISNYKRGQFFIVPTFNSASTLTEAYSVLIKFQNIFAILHILNIVFN